MGSAVVGALVGAIVGGLLALLGSYLATQSANKSNAKLIELEQTRRVQDERRAAVSAVLAEISFNLKLASDPLTTTSNALPVFTMELWQANKGVLLLVDKDAADSLQAGYVALAVANTQATYTLMRLSYGSGHLNDRYKEQVAQMVKYFASAEKSLAEWLNQNIT